MRIISGDYKGKNLFLAENNLTRPLKDLVKESIFNIINHSSIFNLEIKNSIVLDLFSGTGSFGLECHSRGAKEVFFFENYTNALKILKKNISHLKISNNYIIYDKDCFDYFRKNKKFETKFDIIFIDPPYKEKKINELLENIIEKKILKKKGIIIIHRHKKDNVKITDKINIIDTRYYGISKIIFAN